MAKSDETVWFEFVESGVFSRQVTDVGANVLVRIQSDLVRNPGAARSSKERTVFEKPELLILLRRVERVVVIDISTSI